MSGYIARSRIWKAEGQFDRAMADLDRAIQIDPQDTTALNRLAWFWATCLDPKYRDGKNAVKLATRACELDGWKTPYPIGTLAAADAEAGDFDSAVKWQTKANALYSGVKDKADGEARLELYREKKPYRETTP